VEKLRSCALFSVDYMVVDYNPLKGVLCCSLCSVEYSVLSVLCGVDGGYLSNMLFSVFCGVDGGYFTDLQS
jgi:hypothetical protein